MGSLGALAAAATTPATAAKPKPFELTNIDLETNASACDMDVQIAFDTDGIAEGTRDQTEGFQGRVKPPIIDLEPRLGCELSTDAVPHDAALLMKWK